MQLNKDPDQFDAWQAYFNHELLRTIKNQLTSAGLTGTQIRKLTTDIGFHVCCLLDASAPFSVEGESITPMLTFSIDQEVLVHQGAPSSLHEYTHGNADELFNE